MIIFEISDTFERKIKLHRDKHLHILEKPEMKNQEELIRETILSPDEVRESSKSKSVLLYYKHYRHTPVTEKYMLVVVKVLNRDGEVLTSYFTDRIKKGEIVWKKI